MDMKKLKLWSLLLVIFAAVAMTSCGNDDEDDPGLYYVRYTIGVTPGSTAIMNYADVDGNKVIQQVCNSGTIEVTVGPVNYGFKALVTGNELVNGNYRATQWLRIDVSENGAPFVMKEYLSSALSLKYIVGSN